PSLRVAAKRRACSVARLANKPSYSLRRAPRIHHRLASNAHVKASPTGSLDCVAGEWRPPGMAAHRTDASRKSETVRATPELIHRLGEAIGDGRLLPVPAVADHAAPAYVYLAELRRVGGEDQRVERMRRRHAQETGRTRVEHQRIGACAR